jgi:iron(III) transport system substrate-binding protein
VVAGCERAEDVPRVVVYTSVDEDFAREVIEAFEEERGVKVDLVPDTEAMKTTGFLHRLRQEQDAPKADVWWSSEVFTSVQLAEEGVLAPYAPATAEDIPPEWKDPQNRWTGLAARARVLGFNTTELTEEQLPKTWAEIAQPRWANRLAFANPQFGTTRGHLGAMFHLWGEARATAFLKALKEGGVQVVDSNGTAIRMTAQGRVGLCATDTDDVWVQQADGEPVDLVYPAMTEGGHTMWIPNSVGLVAGGPNPAVAKELIDYLVSAEVERLLAQTNSRNVPVRQAVRVDQNSPGPAPEPMDWAAVNAAIPAAIEAAENILLQ